MNRLFQELELPFVPTLVVGFVLLVMVVAVMIDIRFFHDCGCAYKGAPVCAVHDITASIP
jgi:hypothetical protein